MATATHDDGFHEIQLNGKQLVFLFMAGTVVAVVIFLLGVFVGRGVRTEVGDASPVTAQELPSPSPSPVPEIPPAASNSGGPPATAQETLSYPQRLGNAEPPKETLRPAGASPPPSTASEPAKAAAPASQQPPAAADIPAEPAGDGFAIQVAALARGRPAEGAPVAVMMLKS